MRLAVALPKYRTYTGVYIVAIVLAAVTGAVIGYDPRVGWLLMGFMVAVLLVSNALRSLDFSLLILYLSFVLTDLIRRFISYYGSGWGYVGLLTIDVAFILTLLSLYLLFVRRGESDKASASIALDLPPIFKMLLVLFEGWVIIQMFNPYYPSIVLSLAAVREYILPIFAMGLGWFVMHHWDQQQWGRAYRVVLITAIFLIILSLAQAATDLTQLGTLGAILAQPVEHASHTWGRDEVTLNSSVFASSKRYGRYLVMIYPLLWAYLKRRNKRTIARQALALLFVLGCFVSGSREALAILLIIELLTEEWQSSLHRIFMIIVLLVLFLPTLLNSDTLRQRVEFTLSNPDDVLSRFGYMTLSSLITSPEDAPVSTSKYIWGIGASRSGQPLQLVTDSGSLIPGYIYNGGLADSGLHKILLELGFIGLALFVMLQGYLLYQALVLRQALQRDPYYLASRVAIVAWMIFFLKGGGIMISDQMMQIIFWFYVGILMARRQTSFDVAN
jgi:hypothetical protein